MSITAVRFALGHVVCTQEVNSAIAEDSVFAKFITESLNRHVAGDWGDCCESDAKENEYALGKCLRIFSSYNYSDNQKVWIITEADRSSTCILFPNEY